MDTESFMNQIIKFSLGTPKGDLLFYYDAFLNYYAVTQSGCHEMAVEIAVKEALFEGTGNYQPIGREEKLSLIDCVRIDCLSSAIQAYDDIHFSTTTHPCGPVASAILGVSRFKDVTVKDAIEALKIGMEVECRFAKALFMKPHGWYPTGIVGGIGASVAVGRLLHFDENQMAQVMSLAAAYVSGNRGTHGSMTGSYVPAIAAASGFRAAMLVDHGFTSSVGAITGGNGLFALMNKDADLKGALEDIGHVYISEETSCKPYPFGFITFAPIDCVEKIKVDPKDITKMELEISKRCHLLGYNKAPKNQYEGLVSIPYIVARGLVDPDKLYEP